MKLPFGLTGIWGYVVTGLIALSLIASIVLGIKSCKEVDQQNYNTTFNSGVTQEREASQSETINAVKNANEARDTPTSDQLNVVCDKYDRNC